MFLPGESQGRGSLVGCCLWGCTESDTTEATWQQQQSVICIRWVKYWRFSFSISPSNEYSGLISFRIDCFDLLAVQGILKNFQHHSPKTSMLQHSAFFIVQLSHTYMTTGKTIGLTRWTFVGKVMSLLFNMPSSLVVACLPRSKLLHGCSHYLQ